MTEIAATGGTKATRRWLRPRGRLWLHADFTRLWAAQSASLVGSEITALAVPLLAVVALDATAAQMGLLAAAGTAPFLLCSLFAGVWIDRRTRRPVLIATDLIRFGLMLSIPVAAWFDLLSMPQLYLIAFLVGALGVLFEIAHYAYVPALVGKDQVVEANSKLQVSYSAAESAGPGVAGLLVQLATAPVAILLDALSYLVSALFLRRIEQVELPVAPAETRGIRAEIATGLRTLLGHRLLRPIVLGAIGDSIAQKAVAALFVLYATREFDISPLVLGAIFAAGGVGAIPGALLSAPVAGRFGVGRTIVAGWLIGSAAWLAVPLASGRLAAPTLALGMLLAGAAGTIVNIQQWSLRQIVTPDELQGRVTASHRFLVYGAFPIGALLGGWLGSTLGLRSAITICALAGLLPPLIVAFSPVRRLREQPSDTTA